MSYDLSVAPICETSVSNFSLAAACTGSQFLLFMTILDRLVRAKEDVSASCERVTPVETIAEEYDFIVVGGGAAGAAVAARLSEIPDWKVLLIEAGLDEPPGASIPSYKMKFAGTDIDWQFQSTNETGACLSTGGTCDLSMGKVLGGSTVLNGMLYVRGVPQDFEKWAALGNEGWTWDEVEPFFLKSEDNHEIERVGSEHHATGGPLDVESFPWVPEFAHYLQEAAAENGYNLSEDLNGDQIEGFCRVQHTSKNGVRESTGKAFLRPVRNRTNLDIALNATVTRVIFDNLTAIGVEYFKDGELQTTYASREVVLSAGAIKSPHILLLSGVGPTEQLESFNIPVVKDLPGVGQNLHDHPAIFLDHSINEPDTYDLDWVTASEYLAFNTGPLASNGLSQLVLVLSTNYTTADYPDIHIYFNGYQAACATTGELGALQSTDNRTITLMVANLHPISRGSVYLGSSDPLYHPKVTVNYLNEPEDVEVLATGVEKALALADAAALVKHNMTLKLNPVEACSDYTLLSREYWVCYLHQKGQTSYHLAGSCKMGPDSDTLAVVDPRLRVHGITGLRVADASIMPKVTSGNTQAPTIMIGERVADFIKKDWGEE